MEKNSITIVAPYGVAEVRCGTETHYNLVGPECDMHFELEEFANALMFQMNSAFMFGFQQGYNQLAPEEDQLKTPHREMIVVKGGEKFDA